MQVAITALKVLHTGAQVIPVVLDTVEAVKKLLKSRGR